MTKACPHCGADLSPDARVCPECGSDHETGWSDSAQTGDPGLPDEDFDYDDFVQREFGREKPVPRGIHWFWWATAVAVTAAFVWLMLR